MHEFELDQLRRNPAWRTTLKWYWDLQRQARQAAANAEDWVPRVNDVPQVDPAMLSHVHGRLIAFGFLKFEVAGRDVGIRYQLTPLGKQAIGAAAEEDACDSAEMAGVE